MFDHVLDLSFHCHEEENEEVHKENGPKHRDIEYFEECHSRRHNCCSCAGVPKFEFWKTSSKRSAEDIARINDHGNIMKGLSPEFFRFPGW